MYKIKVYVKVYDQKIQITTYNLKHTHNPPSAGRIEVPPPRRSTVLKHFPGRVACGAE